MCWHSSGLNVRQAVAHKRFESIRHPTHWASAPRQIRFQLGVKLGIRVHLVVVRIHVGSDEFSSGIDCGMQVGLIEG